jgi:membrane-bound lytic murein transglycosylase F
MVRAFCRFAWVLPVFGFLVACEVPPPPPPPPPPPVDPEIVEVAPPTEAPPPPRVFPIDKGDLGAIKKRGTLRILVQGNGEALLPRDGASSRLDRDVAEAFGAHLGLGVEVIQVDRFEDLLPWLIEGKGDVVAGRLTVTASRKAQIAFSRPVNLVEEVLVQKTGAEKPAGFSALAGRTVHVLAQSSHEETLRGLAEKDAAGVVITAVDDARDEHDLAGAVARGEIAHTIVDSDVLAHIRAYSPGVEAALVLRNGREIALGLRQENPKLKAALDAFLIQRAMTAHRSEAELLDLDGLKKRGSIRVLTRNDAVSYFLHKGQQLGFDYDFLTLFAKQHGLRVDIVVPPTPQDLIPWLIEGRGDVIAALMTNTPERAARVTFTPPYMFVDEVLVQPAGEAPVTTFEQLAGRSIHVRKTSSVWSVLEPLATQYGFTLVAAAEDLEAADLIARVARKEIPLTVVDSAFSICELSPRADLQATLALIGKRPVALASRTDAPKLQAALATFVQNHVSQKEEGRIVGSTDYNILKKAYFDERRRVPQDFVVASPDDARISRYDDLMQQRSAQYGLDWRLMAAQAYQESRFDPAAKSWVGAQGLFQVMPATGREMGFSKLHDPDEGVHAGVRYMAWLIEQFDKGIPFKHRMRFALAAYNAGKGHVDDARRLAAELGLDRDKWFGHTEKAMLLLQEPKYSKRARYGYVRGEEPVKYVSEIQSRYDNYTTIIPHLIDPSVASSTPPTVPPPPTPPPTP